MCFSGPGNGSPKHHHHHPSEKDRYRSGSSSGSATDNSFPSPDLRKRNSRRLGSSANTNELPVGRVASRSKPPSSARSSAPPSTTTRRKSTRRPQDGGAQLRSPPTPTKKPSSKRGGVLPSPALSELNYRLSGTTPRTRTTPMVRRTSTQSTPRVGVSKNTTPRESPRKGTSSRAFSTTSSQGRLSVATTDAASLAASTSPLLRPGGSSSRASSDAGSSRAGSDAEGQKRSSKPKGLEGLIGLGIMTEGSPRKETASKSTRTASVKTPVAAVKPVVPPPTIRVHAAPSASVATAAASTPATVKAPTAPVPVQNASKPQTPATPATPAHIATSSPQVAPAPQRPTISRRYTYTVPPPLKLKRKDSVASLNSVYSSSSSTDSAVEATVPELIGRTPSSYVYIPQKAPISPFKKPLSLPPPPVAGADEPAKENSKGPLKEVIKASKEPAKPMSKEIPTVRASKEPARRPAKELVKERSHPPPPPPAPQTPIKKYSPTRDSRSSSRASVETVDYAAFVAESQKKKKQQKLKPLLPEMDDPPILNVGSRRSNSVRARAKLFSTPASVAAVAPAPAKPMAGSVPPMHEDPTTLTREGALARMKTEANADFDSDEASDATSEESSLAAEPDVPHHKGDDRALRRVSHRQTKDVNTKPHDTDTLSIYMDSAPPEASIAPPFAPSPPPLARHGGSRKSNNVPPPGATESWYQEATSGPREVEQDWQNAGELWEEDPDLPEAPSPPPSRGFTPASAQGRHHGRRNHSKHNHTPTNYYSYSHGGY